MAFTSYDDIISAVAAGASQDFLWFKDSTFTTAAGSFWSLWASGGVPGAGGYTGTALTATSYDSRAPGALFFADATPPNTLHLFYASAATHSSSTAALGSLTLWDRLLVYNDINMNTTSNTLVAGDTLPRYTTGVGVRLLMEVQTALGANSRTITITYTNSDGTGARTTSFSTVASAAAQRLPHASPIIPLQAGDVGVRSVQSVDLDAGTGAGTAALVLAYPILTIPITAVQQVTERDLVRQIPALPRIHDGACLFWTLAPAGSVAGPDYGGMLRAVEG